MCSHRTRWNLKLFSWTGHTIFSMSFICGGKMICCWKMTFLCVVWVVWSLSSSEEVELFPVVTFWTSITVWITTVLTYQRRILVLFLFQMRGIKIGCNRNFEIGPGNPFFFFTFCVRLTLISSFWYRKDVYSTVVEYIFIMKNF